MTQLTFNTRSAFPRQTQGQRDPTLSPVSSSEGDAKACMARVRRNSHAGRRRQDSEQPEPQRNIRPKATTTDVQLPRYTHNSPPSNLSADNAVNYRPIPRPAQPLATPHWGYGQQGHLEVRSPGSLGSPESSLAGYSTIDSSFASDRNRTLSPLEYTPTHSAASFDQAGSQDSFSAYLSSRNRSGSGSNSFLDRTLHHGASEPLAGIDAICDGSNNDWTLPRVQDLTPPSSMMLPSGLQHVHDLNEPGRPLNWKMAPVSVAPHPLDPRLILHDLSILLHHHPSFACHPRGVGRAGRRNGPLSLESRQNANEVRKERSCLRCFVYKETCDTSREVCQNCASKQARTWKLGCVRPRLMFRSEYLLPVVLNDDTLIHSSNTEDGSAATNLGSQLPLEIGLGPPLCIPVREFLPVGGDLQRPAHLPIAEGGESTAVLIQMYDLPVVISCEKEGEAANHIRSSLLKWYHSTIDCTHESDWAWYWFNKTIDPFAGGIMSLVCEYFQASMPQHGLLKEALALSFFNYIFIYSFNVPEGHVPILQQHMEAQIPSTEYISPSIINLYIKMLMLPPLRDVVKRTLRGLELLLLDQQNARQWRRDLIFCVSFIVMAYLGRTQASVLQFANQKSKDTSKVLTHEAATQRVLEMESEIADLILKYHEQFLKPSPRRKAAAAAPSETEQACEDYAQQFRLMDKIRNFRDDNLHLMPASLEPQCDQPGDFIANNTARICWKYIQAAVPEADIKSEADFEMKM